MIAEKIRLPNQGPWWQGSWWAPRRVFENGQRLVRTHAFRLAALYFLVFAASVSGVLLFVYWTSADFVERQTEATLDAEIAGLAEQYAQRGLSGLFQIVAARSAGVGISAARSAPSIARPSMLGSMRSRTIAS